VRYRRVAAPWRALPTIGKTLTLQNPPSIRAPMAAGAILPPLFLWGQPSREHFGSGTGLLKDPEKPPASITC